MEYKQPELPYSPDALAPAISKETIEYHYGKHEKAYIDNLNAMIKGTEYENMDIEDIIKKSSGALFNNASQAWNHIFYFFSFSPHSKGKPKGNLATAILRQFESFEKFKEEFVNAGVKLFGAGWVWLSKDNDGTLKITQESNAGNPMTGGLTPLLTFDVWEHAYYIDYRNRRKDALDRLWDIINWDTIEDRYNK